MQPVRSGWRQSLGSCWVAVLAIGWKLGLIAFCSLPLPANDAYFFDGAVIHWLREGGYFNPSIVGAFPVSGSELFSAYPPGYQAVLSVWMGIFGTSAAASLWLHGLLWSGFAVIAVRWVQRLGASAAAVNMGALFLFGMTFHDRPDSVAHVLGMLGIVAWSRETGAWSRWVGALLIGLTVTTSLHIGAMYTAMAWMLAFLRGGPARFPWLPALAMVAIPAGILGLAVAVWPRAWDGFVENLLATPSFTGYRWPAFEDLLKVGRTAPGLLLLGGSLAFPGVRAAFRSAAVERPEAAQALAAVLVAGCFTVAATLLVVAPNYVNVAAYPQVPAVALFVWLVLPRLKNSGAGLRRALLAAVVLVSIRAAGLSTWGVLAAVDVPPGVAAAKASQAVAAQPDGGAAMVSSAYLYALVGEQRIELRHADWAGRFGEGAGTFRPTLLVLTPYDYYRRYEAVVSGLEARGVVRVIRVERTWRVPPPDSFPRLQRVVQHVSWAPVLVWLQWP